MFVPTNYSKTSIFIDEIYTLFNTPKRENYASVIWNSDIQTAAEINEVR